MIEQGPPGPPGQDNHDEGPPGQDGVDGQDGVAQGPQGPPGQTVDEVDGAQGPQGPEGIGSAYLQDKTELMEDNGAQGYSRASRTRLTKNYPNWDKTELIFLKSLVQHIGVKWNYIE